MYMYMYQVIEEFKEICLNDIGIPNRIQGSFLHERALGSLHRFQDVGFAGSFIPPFLAPKVC